MTSAHIDFETRSIVDLKKTGVHKYAEDPDTGVWCMAWAIGDGPVQMWNPDKPGLITDLFEYMADGGTVMAHNAAFELAIWNIICRRRFGWPTLPVENTRCTMAMAMAMSLPGGLDGAAQAVSLEIGKDMDGKKLMMQMMKPRRIEADGTIVWWDDPVKRRRLEAYCAQDVEVERELEKRLLPLPAAEQSMWALDQKINNRGVFIDLPAVHKAIELIDSEKIRLDKEMKAVTGGEISTCGQVSAIVDWCNKLVDPIEPIPSLAKADVLEVLRRDDLPPKVRTVLELRSEAAKSSTAKLPAMVHSASDDGRARGLFQYHGANTGRWSGRRIQLQNLPRPKLHQPEIEWFIDTLGQKDRGLVELLIGPTMSAISDSIRGMIRAPDGCELTTVDFNAIEARVLAWLAGQDTTLHLFSGGGDVYCTEAEHIYLRPIDKKKDPDERKVGKVAILALGYQGGISAFQNMARGYDVDFNPIWPEIQKTVTDEELEGANKSLVNYRKRGGTLLDDHALACDVIKQRWRVNNPMVVQYWANLNDAAKQAVIHPGQTFTCGADGRSVKFKMSGSFLFCRLPSGRCLTYPFPRLVDQKAPWWTEENPAMVTTLYYSGQDDAGRWVDSVHTYGGKLAENITQAVARDVLRDAMIRCENAGYPIVFHVHDELVVEHKAGFGSLEEVEEMAAINPVWAKGLPLAAEGWRGIRYRK